MTNATFDDLDIGDLVSVITRNFSFTGLFCGYEKTKEKYFAVFMLGGIFLPPFCTRDICKLAIVEKSVDHLPPVAEASCDFDPETDLPKEYP